MYSGMFTVRKCSFTVDGRAGKALLQCLGLGAVSETLVKLAWSLLL